MGVILLAALALAGCGGDPAPVTPAQSAAAPSAAASSGAAAISSGAGAIKEDSFDVCSIITDAQLRTFFGVEPGEKTPNNGDLQMGCTFEPSSGFSNLALSIAAPGHGAKDIYDVTKNFNLNVEPVDNLGDEAVSSHASVVAAVQILYREAVLTFTLDNEGNPLKAPDETIARLIALAGPALKQIP